jgi:hypothetical protein
LLVRAEALEKAEFECLADNWRACEKYSDRIGRSASAKPYDEQAVRLEVIAHIRHWETNYDELSARGVERLDVREAVGESVTPVLLSWKC